MDIFGKLKFRAVVCGFLLASAFSLFPAAAGCETLPDSVVRLHVVANSDAPEDQAVKLKVRDAVLAEASRWTGEAGTLEEASAALCLHLEAIRAAAEGALAESGAAQAVSVKVADLWFPTREYDDFALPAGTYRTLRVTLGEGKGKNWWCVVFPALCLPAAQKEDPLAFLPESQRELAEHSQNYKVSFKAVELYEELRCALTRTGRS